MKALWHKGERMSYSHKQVVERDFRLHDTWVHIVLDTKRGNEGKLKTLCAFKPWHYCIDSMAQCHVVRFGYFIFALWKFHFTKVHHPVASLYYQVALHSVVLSLRLFLLLARHIQSKLCLCPCFVRRFIAPESIWRLWSPDGSNAQLVITP